MDRWEAFLAHARANSAAEEEYVTVVPLWIAAIGEPDLIYARFLASQLPELEQAVSGWAKVVQTGGLLLVEEVDSISTNVDAFEEYLRMGADLLARHSNRLFVGPALAQTPR